MTPTPEAVREQLDRILAAAAFASAGRHSRLLRYLVERTLAGEGSRLKEYVLATEVLDRPDTYDSRLDSSVRVEMRRLRTRLEEYYGGPGAADPVVITVPRGSYAPAFALRQAAPGGDSGRGAAETPRRTKRAAWIAFAATLVLALLVATLRPQPDRSASAAHAVKGPGIAVLPFESYSTTPGERLLAARLTDAVTTELAKLDTVSVASRTSTSHYGRGARRAEELAAALHVQFVMEASAVADGEELRVAVRLVDAALDRKVWVREYELAPADIPLVSARIAAEAAAGVRTYQDARR